MADHTANDLNAAIHALKDVVAPAVDPSNPLAAEQLQLVITWLQFYKTRFPFAHQRARSELSVALALADYLAGEAEPEFARQLRDVAEAGRGVRADPASGTQSLQETAIRIDALASEVVRASAGWPQERRKAVERVVLDRAKDHLLLQRAWFKPQGIEAKSADIPAVPDLLKQFG